VAAAKNTKDVMENKLHFNTDCSKLHDNQILTHSPQELIQALRNSIASGICWPKAILQTMAIWPYPIETFKGRNYIYLINGECFNLLLLAERLMVEVKDLINVTDLENLLFKGQFPNDFDLSTLKYELGIIKYRGHLNFFYGVIVEETLQYIVEKEIEKRFYSNGIESINDLDDYIFQKLYKTNFSELYTKFCADKSINNKKSYVYDYIEFTYWLFKYRINISDGAKIASDTNKAIKHLPITPQSCFAPILFQLS